jgi:hypothetical protein
MEGERRRETGGPEILRVGPGAPIVTLSDRFSRSQQPTEGVPDVAIPVRLIIASLVLATHVVSASPLLAAGAPPVPDPPCEQSDCCPPDSDTDAELPQGSDDCCPDGCKHCPLSCCGGGPALVGDRPADLARPVTSPGPPARACRRLPVADPSKIYHPPRI